MSGDAGIEERRRARQSWPGLKTTLADAPDADDLRAYTTIDQRLAMMWPLTVNAWLLSGRALPTYSRAQMPGHVTRR